MFVKGQSGNPAGKPKGLISERRKKFLAIQERAQGDYEQVYDEVREYMRKGERWAFDRYYDIVGVPRNLLDKTIVLDLPKIDSSSDIDTAIKELSTALLENDITTTDEVHQIIKTLVSTKAIETTHHFTDIVDIEELKEEKKEMEIYEELKKRYKDEYEVLKNN